MSQALNLVLVGLMGSGKSAVGREIARMTGSEFLDLDHEVERNANKTVSEIFATEGEIGFRALETEVLLAVLDQETPRVIATGGGAVLSVTNRLQMRSSGRVVWLRAAVPTLVARVKDDTNRPLLGEDPTSVLTTQRHDRRSAYASAAHQVVDVDNYSVTEVAEMVIGGCDLPWLHLEGER